MLIFILSCLALVVFIIVTISPALFSSKAIREVDLDQVNLDIARQRLEEISALSPYDLSDEQIQAREELEATLAEDLNGPAYRVTNQRTTGIVTAAIILITIPVAAGLIYNQLGLPGFEQKIAAEKASQAQAMAQTGVNAEDQDRARASLDVLLKRLEEKLVENPENPQGWTLAARTYMSIGQFDKAEEAFAEANRLVGPDPDILTSWADATLMVNGNVFTDEVNQRIQQALELEPEQVNALWIAGLGASARDDNNAAIEYFRRVQPLVANDTEATAQVQQMLVDLGAPAEAVLVAQTNALTSTGTSDSGSNTGSTQATLTQAQSQAVEAPSGHTISVTVRLDPAMENQASPGDLVFIFAKAPSGPPFPLAAVRIQVRDLPTAVQLDNTTAMMPNMNISGFDQVLVSARVSKTGDPIAKPGDLTSESILVETASNPSVDLNISQVVE